jgi:hypothetical protein
MFVAAMVTPLTFALMIVPFTYTRSPPRAFPRYDLLLSRRKTP